MRNKLRLQADEIFDDKVKELSLFTEGLEYIVTSLRDNRFLYTYLNDQSDDNLMRTREMFKAVAQANPSLMQVRFLDEKGMEKVRVDWRSNKPHPEFVPNNKLQDKGHRYYFQEASEVSAGTFWYSKLDLNVENRQIEIPHKPVLRVASPVYIDQKFRGIVIINVHAKEFLGNFTHNALFDICLIDGDGYFIVSHNEKKSWARYLATGFGIDSEYPELRQRVLNQDHGDQLSHIGELYVGSVKKLLTADQAILLMHPKQDAIITMRQDRQKASVVIIALILLLSVPLALVISKRPAELYRKIAEQNKELMESMRLIDMNIHTGTIDLRGNFIGGSQAFASILGVTKKQLQGEHYSRFFCKKMPEQQYHDIWQELQHGKSWSGELRHEKMNGECYWADALFVPRLDEDGNTTCYSAIYQDITDKKHIEELSITDVMTGLYNRRFFNTVLDREYGRAQRDGRTFSFAMLDVDFFKDYNDNYGHHKGDEVLQKIAATISNKLHRGSDFCFRLGGEEFGIIFNDLSPDEALGFADSIKDAIMAEKIEHKWSKVANVITVSIGLLSLAPSKDTSVDMVYRLADEALYAAKKSGRNIVVTKDIT